MTFSFAFSISPWIIQVLEIYFLIGFGFALATMKAFLVWNYDSSIEALLVFVIHLFIWPYILIFA